MTSQASIIVIPADPSQPVRTDTMTTDISGMQAAVGGYAQSLGHDLSAGWIALNCEDAKMHGYPANGRAQQVLNVLGYQYLGYLHGDVIFSGSDSEGETVDVPAGLLGKILAIPGVAAV